MVVHVAVLEKAGPLAKRRSGREQLASGEVDVVRSVDSMLGEFEATAAATSTASTRSSRDHPTKDT